MRLRDALPRGHTLPAESWERRHRCIMWLLWLNAAGLLAFSLARGFALPHAVLDAVPVAGAALLARLASGRKLRAAISALGLLSASALAVHVSGGYIEAHFHFFVVIVVLTLYEDWLPFLLAVAYVVIHHGLATALDHHAVYNHPDAIAHPWKWAGIHAAFVAAAGLGSIVSWRLNESLRESKDDALSAARTSEERFRSAFHDAVIGMCMTSPNGRFLRVNPALCGMLGYSAEELEAMSWAELTHPDDRGDSTELVRQMLSGEHDSRAAEKRYFHADGHVVWASLSARLVRDAHGVPLHFVTQIQDISAQKEANARLAHQALHDPLTDLPNRTLFADRLEQALARTRRSGTRIAVAFVDIDRFKLVNDSLGHSSGDWLLVQIAGRLEHAVRAADSVGRFGGDEFVLLFDGVENEHVAIQVADRVRRDLMRPFTLDGDEDFFVTASLGIALSDDGATAETLLRDADAAMYRAKAAGGARYELFDADMREAAGGRLRTERALRRGLAHQEFRLHYQPIWSLQTGALEAVEALIRWQRPGHGLLAPGAFIGVAEESGLIQDIGEWVLREACRQAADWRRELGDAAPLPVHVNASARQLGQAELPLIVEDALAGAGLDPSDLVIEITESGLLENTELPAQIMHGLKALGVRVVLDDFGTGCSSLSHLKRFPIDELKIDRNFVIGEDAAIVQAILGMARALGLSAVAEGVETEEQAEGLRALGCERAQGYWLGRPAEPEQMAALVSPARAARSSAPRLA